MVMRQAPDGSRIPLTFSLQSYEVLASPLRAKEDRLRDRRLIAAATTIRVSVA